MVDQILPRTCIARFCQVYLGEPNVLSPSQSQSIQRCFLYFLEFLCFRWWLISQFQFQSQRIEWSHVHDVSKNNLKFYLLPHAFFACFWGNLRQRSQAHQLHLKRCGRRNGTCGRPWKSLLLHIWTMIKTCQRKGRPIWYNLLGRGWKWL